MLTPEQFLCQLSDAYEKNILISKAKNKDYSGDVDAFANFKQIEILTGGKITAELGILTRMSDKMIRVANLLANGNEAAVKDEKIGDTLADLANYAMILKIYIEHKSSQKKMDGNNILATDSTGAKVLTYK